MNRSQATHFLKKSLGGHFNNEGPNINIDEGGHEKLAVETIHHSPVARNHVTEILKTKDRWQNN